MTDLQYVGHGGPLIPQGCRGGGGAQHDSCLSGRWHTIVMLCCHILLRKVPRQGQVV